MEDTPPPQKIRATDRDSRCSLPYAGIAGGRCKRTLFVKRTKVCRPPSLSYQTKRENRRTFVINATRPHCKRHVTYSVFVQHILRVVGRVPSDVSVVFEKSPPKTRDRYGTSGVGGNRNRYRGRKRAPHTRPDALLRFQPI